jgi:hypothetical protein
MRKRCGFWIYIRITQALVLFSLMVGCTSPQVAIRDFCSLTAGSLPHKASRQSAINDLRFIGKMNTIHEKECKDAGR